MDSANGRRAVAFCARCDDSLTGEPFSPLGSRSNALPPPLSRARDARTRRKSLAQAGGSIILDKSPGSGVGQGYLGNSGPGQVKGDGFVTTRQTILTAAALAVMASAACSADDILVADFEGEDYAGWIMAAPKSGRGTSSEGPTVRAWPARADLPSGSMPVAPRGKRLFPPASLRRCLPGTGSF